MDSKPPKPDDRGNGRPKQAETRAERLKAALKANLGRRKTQARARRSADDKD